VSELRRQVHTLAGTMRMFGLAEAERVARELEQLAATGSLEGAQPLVEELVAAAAKIVPELERFAATGGEPAR
jgi:HPt (histidine-containing phosphotransfer) domain-containing protein